MRPIDGDSVRDEILYGEAYVSAELEVYINRVFDDAPTLDYKDLVPQGEWIDCRGGNATCSRCRIRQKAIYDDDNEQHFCGHCGARMKGGESE